MVRSIQQQCGLLIVSHYQYFDLAHEIIYLDILPTNKAITALRAWSTDKEYQTEFQVWNDNNSNNDQLAYEICEQLGRLPLALRLAGRYMLHSKTGPDTFLNLWPEQNLSLLSQKGSHPHDSVEILIEKSIEQVGEDEAREAMGVVGLLSDQPFTIEVIAAALEKSPNITHKLIQDLWKFSLITRLPTERWQVVHKLIYTYAKKKIETTGRDNSTTGCVLYPTGSGTESVGGRRVQKTRS